ncbi:MAG: hypothetical protein HXY51_10425 [Nitrospirae bacterium]|nr:hypothetical protein [Nitrospirota bacterium]
MEREGDLTDYRSRLLNGVRAGISRSACGTSDSIQVFVNQRRVGLLDGKGADATLQVQSDDHIDSVHLRSEDGVLLGGLVAPEYGFRTSRIPLLRNTIELRVQNYAHGGSVSAVSIPAPSFWRRLRRALVGVADSTAPRQRVLALSGVRTIAFTQILLAVALVGLVVDRTTDWMTPVRPPLPATQAEAHWTVPLAEVAKLEQQLAELSRMHAKAVETIQAQQQGMAQLQRTMAKLSSTQETIASSVLSVKQDMGQRENGAGRDADRMRRVSTKQTQSVREQLEAEIHSLTVANDRLSTELAHLDQNNRQLREQVKSVGVDVSKATPPTSQEAGGGE